MKKQVVLALAFGLLAAPATAFAQQATAPTTVVLQQFLIKEIDQNGKKAELAQEAPKSVTPGSILEQRVTVKNITEQAIKTKGVRLPVPKGLTFVSIGKDQSAVYSIDGGKTFAAHPMKTVVDKDGKSKQVPAELSDYTMIRWDLPQLAGGASKTFSARFKVN